VWSTLPDGYHDYYNARWYEFTGMPEGSTDGEEWNGMFHPDDQERAWTTWRHSLETGDPYQIEYRLRRADGAYRWTLGRALPLRDDAGKIVRWFGTCTDIHEQKQASEEREVIAQELSHRIKNIFAVISGLIGFAARAKPELKSLAEDLRDRIAALGRAHDFVRPHSAQSRPQVAQDSLRGLLEELFRPYQSKDDQRIIVTSSGMNAMVLIVQTLCGAGDNAVCISPSWPNIFAAIQVMGAEPRQVALTGDEKGWHLDLEKLFNACDARTKAIYLASPGNPTGWVMPEDQRRALLDFAAEGRAVEDCWVMVPPA